MRLARVGVGLFLLALVSLWFFIPATQPVGGLAGCRLKTWSTSAPFFLY